MTAKAKRYAARGRHLDIMTANQFLFCVPPLLKAAMDVQGYVLRPSTRPYLASDGTVQVRLVWRRKCHDDTAVLTLRLRGNIPEPLIAALADAMAPKVLVANA